METRCYGCMKIKRRQPVCEHCGYDERRGNELHQLPVGTMLRDQYIVGKVLGQGGFGITYLGWDDSLLEPVAIKEYFPNGQVSRNATRSPAVECTAAAQTFTEGRDRFLNEARTLAKLRRVGSIVQVMSFFSENNTAYIVMEYVEGITLLEYMQQRGGKLTVSETFTILQPVLKALSRVHQAGMIHRDISPDNIMLQNDGTVKLLDFGTARDVDRRGGLAHSTQAVLKHGFAPMEQYSSGRAIDRRADQYALAATVWCCLTGQVPPDAPSMIMDGAKIDWSGIPGLTEQQRRALETATAFRADDRFDDLDALHEALFPPVASFVPPAYPPVVNPTAGSYTASQFASPAPAPAAWEAIPMTLPMNPAPQPPYTPPSPAPEEDPQAQYQLGLRYETGDGVEEDLIQAVAWYKRAANQKYLPAINQLAACYFLGNGVQQDSAAAASWWRNGALLKDPEAQYRYGLCCLKGTGVPRSAADAAAWFQRAAEQGYPEAQFELGMCYIKGSGVTRDKKRGLTMCLEAADSSIGYLQYRMAQLYFEGTGVAKSDTMAAAWLRRGAELGDPFSQVQLAQCYLRGKGVEKSIVMAAEWAKLAMEQDFQEGLTFYTKLFTTDNSETLNAFGYYRP